MHASKRPSKPVRHATAADGHDSALARFCLPVTDSVLCCFLQRRHLQSLLHPAKGFKPAVLQGEVFTQAVGRIFAFAYVWALGGNLAPAARHGFDEHVREQLQDVVSFPGGLGAVMSGFCGLWGCASTTHSTKTWAHSISSKQPAVAWQF